MDNASDNWFTLDAAGDANVACDASAKDKGYRDLERLVFGDNFSSRLKVPKSEETSDKKKPRTKDRAPKPVLSQKKTTTRRAAGATSDDGDSSSIGGAVPASSDDGARSDDAVNQGGDCSRDRAPVWQDEDDDAVQACDVQQPRVHVSHMPSGGSIV
jgi:hypothetical protein